MMLEGLGGGNMDMTIRAARPDDWEALFTLQLGVADLSVDSYYSPITNYDSFKFALNEFYGDDDDDAAYILAEVDSSLVGFLVGFEYRGSQWDDQVVGVLAAYVKPGYQRKGIGSALMKKFEKWGDSREHAETVVFCTESPEFYSALGYVDTGGSLRHVSMLTAEQIAAMAASNDAPTTASETSDE